MLGGFFFTTKHGNENNILFPTKNVKNYLINVIDE